MENRTFIPLISSNYLSVNRSVIFCRTSSNLAGLRQPLGICVVVTTEDVLTGHNEQRLKENRKPISAWQKMT